MTETETQQALYTMQSLYPNFMNGRDVVVMTKAWMMCFPNENLNDVESAIMVYYGTKQNGYIPTPGELKAIIDEHQKDAPQRIEQADVRRIGSSGYTDSLKRRIYEAVCGVRVTDHELDEIFSNVHFTDACMA